MRRATPQPVREQNISKGLRSHGTGLPGLRVPFQIGAALHQRSLETRRAALGNTDTGY